MVEDESMHVKASIEKALDWASANNYRMVRSLVYSLPNMGRADPLPSKVFERIVAHFINRVSENEESLSAVLKDIDDHKFRTEPLFLDISHFDWIDAKNERLIHWLLFQTSNQRSSLEGESLEDRRNYFISLIDDHPNFPTLDSKLAYINQCKSFWSNIFQSEDFKWLDSKNTLQIDWAWDYFFQPRKGGHAKFQGFQQRLNSFSPVNSQEKYINLLMFFDTFWSHISERDLLLRDIKQAWRQKALRDKKNGKKSYTLIMSDNIAPKLKSMAKAKGISQGELVESLLLREFEIEKSSYLD